MCRYTCTVTHACIGAYICTWRIRPQVSTRMHAYVYVHVCRSMCMHNSRLIAHACKHTQAWAIPPESAHTSAYALAYMHTHLCERLTSACIRIHAHPCTGTCTHVIMYTRSCVRARLHCAPRTRAHCPRYAHACARTRLRTCARAYAGARARARKRLKHSPKKKYINCNSYNINLLYILAILYT